MDTSFSDDGVAWTGLDSTGDSGYALAVDPTDGTVYVAALHQVGIADPTASAYVAALAPDGQLVTTFGNAGIAAAVTANANAGLDLTLDTERDRLYLAVSEVDPADPDDGTGVVGAFTTAGVLDGSFASGGYAQLAISADAIGRYGLALDTDRDRIYVASWEYRAADEATYPFVTAYGPDGAVDTSFGDQGVVRSPYTGNRYSGKSVAVDPDDGTVFLIAYADDGPLRGQVYVAAFTPAGGVDETFGASGLATTGAAASSFGGSEGIVDPTARRLYVTSATDGDSLLTAFDLVPDVVAVDDAGTVVHDRSLTVPAPGPLGNDSGGDGPLSVVPVDAATTTQGGSVSIAADGGYRYAPPAGFVGDDSFTYSVTDGERTAVGTVVVTVTNVAPVAPDAPPSYSTGLDEMLQVAAPGVLAGASDGDGDVLHAALAGGADAALAAGVPLASGVSAAGGSVVVNDDGSFTYTPPAGFSGADQFAVTASDGIASTAPLTVAITVADPPPTSTSPNTTSPGTTSPDPTTPPTTVVQGDPPATSVPVPPDTPELPATGGRPIPPGLIVGLLVAGIGATIVARRRPTT